MKKLLSFLLSISLAITAFAQTPTQTSTPAPKASAKITCGPYVQNVSENSFSIVWETDMDAIAWVEIAPDDGTHFYNKDRDKFYDLRGYGVQPIGKIHKVRVTGLKPGTTYRYRIMMKGVEAFEKSGRIVYARPSGSVVFEQEPYRAKTFGTSYETVHFDVYNDIHENDSLFNILMAGSNDKPDFVYLNGDMTSSLITQDRIVEKFLRTAATNLKGETPLFVARGNHELRGPDAIHWIDYFDTPTDKPYYTFKMGKYFFIALDSCEDKPDDDIEYNGSLISDPYLEQETQWLKEVVASKEFKDAKVKIVFSHIPPETKGWHGNLNVCNYFVPVLNKANIDVMICGHLHEWRFDEKGCGMSNANFPVVVNNKLERMEVSANAYEININTFDTTGANTHSILIKNK
jgi:Icc-related predicted phosphoesterase